MRSLGTLSLSGFETLSLETLLNYWNMKKFDVAKDSTKYLENWLKLTDFVVCIALAICHSKKILISNKSKNDVLLKFIKITMKHIGIFVQKVYFQLSFYKYFILVL